LGRRGAPVLAELLKRKALGLPFRFGEEFDPVLTLMRKYSDVPMSFADACLVRMTEMLPNPVVLTTDSDFRIYRRHGRRTVPSILPSY
ncbi:MAG TPA: hypothetical protein VFT69_07170, partial [Pseudolabrys sp.]|nr:hypothetical protein [Pseudolabrys sp.]